MIDPQPSPLIERMLEAFGQALKAEMPEPARDGKGTITFSYTNLVEAMEAALAACELKAVVGSLQACDGLVRSIRHRDARWHDDEAVLTVLEQNRAILARLEGK